jgi:hypothetical protein
MSTLPARFTMATTAPRSATPYPGVLQKRLQIVDFAGDNFFGSGKEAANYCKQKV